MSEEKVVESELEPMNASNLPVIRAEQVENEQLTAQSVIAQVRLIQEVMRDAMKSGEHYGVIPGCGDKPALLKPGAEKLALTFRLAPRYAVERIDHPAGHREYDVTCALYAITTGRFLGEGVGTASTLESKYRYRRAERKCPKCGKETIIKGKADYGGGWLCWQKRGGCGAKWRDGDKEIEGQVVERVEHPDPADHYNTVKKMAKKRAFVDACLTATAASDIFTQDLEDMQPDVKPAAAPVPPDPELDEALNHFVEGEQAGQGETFEAATEGQLHQIESLRIETEQMGARTSAVAEFRERLKKTFGVEDVTKLSTEQADVVIKGLARWAEQHRKGTANGAAG